MSFNNPFVGLRPFESNESLLFFGRQEQTLELLQRLHLYHFVAVTGGSGSGKSSLIKAGLIPRLKAGYLVNDRDRWVIATMKPGQTPLYNLSDGVLSQLNHINDNLTTTTLEEKINKEGVDAILNILNPLWETNTNFFLLVDQFEELFRFFLNQKEFEKKNEAIDFVNVLLDLSAQKNLPIYVVITMRSDFIGDCAQFYGLPEAMNQSQYIVPRLNRVQLRNTIEGPVRLHKGSINSALTTRLLNDAQVVKDELPLLQHALMRIWDRNKNTHPDGELDLEDYDAIGGIEKALSNHADEALKGMSETELRLTKKMFQALTSIDENGRKIRRPARLSELKLITGADSETLLSIINRFIEGKKSFLIINNVEGKDDYLIDISHESLIRQWSTLNAWVDEEAESGKIFLRLIESAKLYQENKKNLLIGNELHQVLQWYYSFRPDEAWAQHYSPYYQNSIQYLKQSEQEEKKQRKKKNRNLALLFAAAILVIIIISRFAFLIYQNNIKTKEQLALNYWKNGQTARAENNFLDAFHLIAEAADRTNDKELIQDILIDEEPYLPQTCLKNIFIHGDIVNSAVFSPDGKWIVTAGNDKIARVWDAATGKQIGDDMKHEWPVNSAVFSPDSKWILTASNDKTAGIWDIGTGKEINSFKHEDAVTSAVFSRDGKSILTACADNYARLWDVATTKQIRSFEHAAAVTSAVFSPDEKRILTSGNDFTARLWDAATGKLIVSLNHKAPVTSAVFSQDGKWILTSAHDSTARLWNSINGKQTDSLKHEAAVTDAVFSPDEKWILTAGKDKTARLWDVVTKKQIGPAMKHDGQVYSVAFSPDGNWILTAGGDKNVRLWYMATIPSKIISFKQKSIVTGAVFSPDGKWILTSGYDSAAHIWDAASKKQIGSFMHEDVVYSAVFSPDGKWILTASRDKTARLWDVVTKKQIGSPMKYKGAVTSAVFSPDGKWILTAGSDHYAWLWDAGTGKKITSFEHNATVTRATFSPDGKSILVASDSSAYLLDAISGKQLAVFKHEDMVHDAVFSPDGKWILTASWDNTARIWDVVTGKQAGPEMKHDAGLNSAVFSPDGKWILTAGWDKAAHIWYTATLKEIGLAKKHEAAVTSAVFSPDGKWILTGGYDSAAHLWEIEGDLDFPASLFKLQAKAITGVAYNTETSETRCIPTQNWLALKEEYYNQAREHYKICKYSPYNLWRRFNKDEAEKIRPDEQFDK